MGRLLLRIVGWSAYAALVLLAFVLAGYWSFGTFIRRGVTTVPHIVGSTAAEARESLAEAGLELGSGREAARYDETMPAGRVLLQDPAAGGLVKRGVEVVAVMSLGPELVEVPELEGKALQAAQVTLTAAGLDLGATGSIYTLDGVPGTVAVQDPPAGSLVTRNTEVRLYIALESRAQTFLMPDLVYRNFDQVRRFFVARGLKMGSVKFEAYEGVAQGVVLRQYPLAGHPLRPSDVISLVVATAEERGAA